MEFLAQLLLFAWVPLVLVLFWSSRHLRRAVIAAYLGGLLLLPVASYKLLPSIPTIEKFLVTNLGVFLGIVFFDSARLRRFKPSWLDLPMLVFCISPFASSIANDLGVYDGFSALAEAVMRWGIPYLVGRVYFGDLQGLRELAIGTFVAGVFYLPPILLESRLAPQLHSWIFGVPGVVSWESVAFFGPLRWKPAVFMQSALALTMFMTAATLCGYWLWSQGGLRWLRGIRVHWLLLAALAGAFLGKTLGGVTLLFAGGLSLWVMRWARTALPLALLLAVPLLYVPLRATGLWSGQELTTFIAENLSERRAESLDTRLANENILVEKALRRPVFGWGRWGRSRIYDQELERDLSITDGLWIILLGCQGFVGLVSFTLILLLPPLFLLWKVSIDVWLHSAFAPATVLITLLLLHAIDNLGNAMFNPLFILAAGGSAGLVTLRTRIRRAAPTRAIVPVQLAGRVALPWTRGD